MNTLGSGTLVDNGNGLWNPLTPYSIVNGMVIVEGTVNPTPQSPINNVVSLTTDANYQSLTNPDFRVTVHFADGSTLARDRLGDLRRQPEPRPPRGGRPTRRAGGSEHRLRSLRKHDPDRDAVGDRPE